MDLTVGYCGCQIFKAFLSSITSRLVLELAPGNGQWQLLALDGNLRCQLNLYTAEYMNLDMLESTQDDNLTLAKINEVNVSLFQPKKKKTEVILNFSEVR